MLHSEGRASHAWGRVSLGEVVMCLTDLIDFFQQPKEDEGMYIQFCFFCLSVSLFFRSSCCVCLFVLVTFNNFSVISLRCLVATGSSMLSYIVLPHWSIMPQTLDMIPHPVTLSWHWVNQSELYPVWVPSEEQLVPFLTTLVCQGPGSNPWPPAPQSRHSTEWAAGASCSCCMVVELRALPTMLFWFKPSILEPHDFLIEYDLSLIWRQFCICTQQQKKKKQHFIFLSVIWATSWENWLWGCVTSYDLNLLALLQKLESWNFGYSKYRYCTIQGANIFVVCIWHKSCFLMTWLIFQFES